jgi:hypothetical protein
MKRLSIQAYSYCIILVRDESFTLTVGKMTRITAVTALCIRCPKPMRKKAGSWEERSKNSICR